MERKTSYTRLRSGSQKTGRDLLISLVNYCPQATGPLNKAV